MSVSGSVGIVYVLASWVCWWLVFWGWVLVVCVRVRLVLGWWWPVRFCGFVLRVFVVFKFPTFVGRFAWFLYLCFAAV